MMRLFFNGHCVFFFLRTIKIGQKVLEVMGRETVIKTNGIQQHPLAKMYFIC